MKLLTTRSWLLFAAVPVFGALATAAPVKRRTRLGRSGKYQHQRRSVGRDCRPREQDVCARGSFARCFAKVLTAADGQVKSFATPTGYGPSDIQSATISRR